MAGQYLCRHVQTGSSAVLYADSFEVVADEVEPWMATLRCTNGRDPSGMTDPVLGDPLWMSKDADHVGRLALWSQADDRGSPAARNAAEGASPT